MVGLPEGYPKPRHHYAYMPQPGMGNRGQYMHAQQLPNGAPYSPVVGGMGYGMGYGIGMGYGMGMGMGYGGYGMGYQAAVHPQAYKLTTPITKPIIQIPTATACRRGLPFFLRRQWLSWRVLLYVC